MTTNKDAVASLETTATGDKKYVYLMTMICLASVVWLLERRAI